MTVLEPAAAQRQRTVRGTCHHDCPDSCGWLVTVEDQGLRPKAVRLRGNPEHPYSAGELCPKVNRFLERVYSPHRIRFPMIRTGAKGEGEFRRATWSEALELVAARLQAVSSEHGAEAIMPWSSAGTQGLIQGSSLDRRLFARLGATRPLGSMCGLTAGAGMEATMGSRLGSDPLDVRHARMVMLWGTNTKLTNRHLWPFVEEARAAGAPVVVVDPLRTVTAEAADWHLQPYPGTDVALMLGMLHVIIRDGLVDHDYVHRHTQGFDELAAHVASWSPQRASEVTGVDPSDLEFIAQLYGSTTPAFIRTLIGPEHREHGAMFFRTLACLPAVTGNWRHLGGGLARSVGSWNGAFVDDSVFDAPHLWPDGRAPRGINVNHLGRALTHERLDPRVMALVVWNANPAVTAPRSSLVRRGLAREDLFTIVSEQFPTDTVRYADVVLPATTQVEHVDVVPAWGHLYLGWNDAAIPPVGEAVPNTELWRRLAGAMGFTEPELFASDEDLITQALTGVDVEALRRDGFVRLPVPEDLRPWAEGGFPTASGRIELSSPGLAARGHGALPEYRAPQEGWGSAVAERFPLALLTPKLHTRFLNSSYSPLPGHGDREGAPYVEIDAADAERRGVADGDRVRVYNDRASLDLVARVPRSGTGRGRPGVVVVPFGWWRHQHADDSVANDLTSDTLADWGGGVAYYDVSVEVELTVPAVSPEPEA